MNYSNEQKEQITQLIEAKRANKLKESDASFARKNSITPVDFSNIVNRKWKEQPSLLSEKKWTRLAFITDYKTNGVQRWETANTFVSEYIHTLLKASQQTSLPTILIDEPGIGKSHSCIQYSETAANAFYVRCSDCPTKSRLVEHIAKSMGLPTNKKTEELIYDITTHANSVQTPILILDEAGFLRPTAWNIVHRIYNACEFQMSIFLVGSVGLENEIAKGIKRKANGYKEVFSRLGSKYIPVFKNESERKKLLLSDFKKVIKKQGINQSETIQTIISTADDLRRVRREVIKIQRL